MNGGALGLIVAGALVVIYLTWPVCVWLLAGALVALALHRIHTASEGKYRAAITKDLRDAAIAVAGGIGLVAAMQLMLQVSGWMVSEETVRSWENTLISAKDALSFLMNVKTQGPLWAMLLLLSLVRGIPIVKAYNDRRKLFARILIALNTMASFTFFSSNWVETGQIEWESRRMDRAKSARIVRETEEAQRKLASYGWIDKQLRSLTPAQRVQFRLLFRDSQQRPASGPLIEWKTERLAEKLPAAADSARGKTEKATPQFFETLHAEVKAWAVNDGPQPRLSRVTAFESEARRMEFQLAQTEIAVTEVVKSILGDFVTADMTDPIAKAFTKSMSGGIVKTALKDWFPKSVKDLATARQWVEDGFGHDPETFAWKFQEVPADKPQVPVVAYVPPAVAETDPPRRLDPVEEMYKKWSRRTNRTDLHEDLFGPGFAQPGGVGGSRSNRPWEPAEESYQSWALREGWAGERVRTANNPYGPFPGIFEPRPPYARPYEYRPPPRPVPRPRSTFRFRR